MITNFLVAIIVVSLVIVLISSYLKNIHTKALPKTNPWDMASLPHRNRKATFFAREEGIHIVKESSNEKVHRVPNKPHTLTKRNRTISTLTKKQQRVVM